MRILLTGASSFTGLWFAKALAERGHQVTALLQSPLSAYTELRGERVHQLTKYASLLDETAFGDKKCLATMQQGSWDIFCHHAADVTNYKSPDFDFYKALERNTHSIKEVLEALIKQGCQRVILTGSIFEQGEGLTNGESNAISPYGLSKGLTSDVFTYFCSLYNLPLGKFVIPNPFGPYEEPRFTTYLAKCWLNDQVAQVSSPDYIRDNIPVSLLAKKYALFVEQSPSKTIYKCNPSFKPESQGSFVQHFANKMRPRLKKPCEFNLQVQTVFSEPRFRINNDPIDLNGLDWDESLAWDELAQFYLQSQLRLTSK